MAGPGLSTTVTAATTGHPAASNAVHAIVNEFDTTIGSAATGDLLRFNGSEWIHSTALAALPAGSTLTITKSAGTWPGVATTRTDIIYIWKGADPSPAIVSSRTLGVAGMLDNVDMRFVTS